MTLQFRRCKVNSGLTGLESVSAGLAPPKAGGGTHSLHFPALRAWHFSVRWLEGKGCRRQKDPLRASSEYRETLTPSLEPAKSWEGLCS